MEKYIIDYFCSDEILKDFSNSISNRDYPYYDDIILMIPSLSREYMYNIVNLTKSNEIDYDVIYFYFNKLDKLIIIYNNLYTTYSEFSDKEFLLMAHKTLCKNSFRVNNLIDFYKLDRKKCKLTKLIKIEE